MRKQIPSAWSSFISIALFALVSCSPKGGSSSSSPINDAHHLTGGVNTGTGELVFGGGTYTVLAELARGRTIRILLAIASGLDTPSVCRGLYSNDNAPWVAPMRDVLVRSAAKAASSLATIPIIPVISGLSMPDGKGGRKPVHALFVPGDGTTGDPEKGRRIYLSTHSLDTPSLDNGAVVYLTHEAFHASDELNFQDLDPAPDFVVPVENDVPDSTDFPWVVLQDEYDDIGRCVSHYPDFHQPGDNDPSFGDKGLVVVPDNGWVAGVALQSANKAILVTNSAESPASCSVRRLLLDQKGAVDTGFGAHEPSPGLVKLMATGQRIICKAFAIDAQGGIIFVGGRGVGSEFYWLVGRLLPDGTRDTTFGTLAGPVSSGINREVHADSPNTSFDTFAVAIAIAPNGKILVGGNSWTDDGNTQTQAYVARYNANGSPDTTWSDHSGPLAGVKTLPRQGLLNTLATVNVLGDGRVVALGSSLSGSPGVWKPTMYRLLENGNADTSFTSTGARRYTNIGSALEQVAVQEAIVAADGKITWVGRFWSARDGSDSVGVAARYLNTGELDTTFAGTGILAFPTPNHTREVSYALAALPKGAALVGGYFTDLSGLHGTIRSISTTGKLNPDFTASKGAEIGKVLVDFRAGNTSVINLLPLANGMFLVSGLTDVRGDNRQLRRYAYVSLHFGSFFK